MEDYCVSPNEVELPKQSEGSDTEREQQKNIQKPWEVGVGEGSNLGRNGVRLGAWAGVGLWFG